MLCSCWHKKLNSVSYVEKMLDNNPKRALAFLKKNEKEWMQQDSMLFYLEMADAQNKAFFKMQSSQTLEDVKDAFSHRGDKYNFIRAWYLLGCAYRDEGESPKAINCYQNAISLVKGHAIDEKYAKLLVHVYGQMLDLFSKEVLPYQMLWTIDNIKKYSVLAKDTLSLAMAYESCGEAYKILHNADSAIVALKHAVSLYKAYDSSYVASVYSQLLPLYVDKGKLEAAKRCILISEQKPWDYSVHDTTNGFYIYYYEKGKYYLAINQLDSAEICFRKVLCNKQDDNSQEAGLRGLYLLYKQKNIKDSLVRYADLAYRMNDKRILDLSTNEVQRMHLFYNYTRHQRLAYDAEIKAKHSTMLLWITSLVVALLFLILISVFYFNIKNKKAMHMKFVGKMKALADAKQQLLLLKQNELDKLMREKTAEIRCLNDEILVLQKKDDTSIKKALEDEMQTTSICQKFHKAGSGYITVSMADWRDLECMLYERLPNFKKLLETHCSLIDNVEFKICLLIRLSFKPSEICNLLYLKSSAVSMKRERLLTKLFELKGKARDFDRRLVEIF